MFEWRIVSILDLAKYLLCKSKGKVNNPLYPDIQRSSKWVGGAVCFLFILIALFLCFFVFFCILDIPRTKSLASAKCNGILMNKSLHRRIFAEGKSRIRYFPPWMLGIHFSIPLKHFNLARSTILHYQMCLR